MISNLRGKKSQRKEWMMVTAVGKTAKSLRKKKQQKIKLKISK